MVSITSILINSKNTTLLYLHFLIGKDVDSNNFFIYTFSCIFLRMLILKKFYHLEN